MELVQWIRETRSQVKTIIDSCKIHDLWYGMLSRLFLGSGPLRGSLHLLYLYEDTIFIEVCHNVFMGLPIRLGRVSLSDPQSFLKGPLNCDLSHVRSHFRNTENVCQNVWNIEDGL